MLAKLRGNKSHPTKNTKHRRIVSLKTWFESKKTDPPVIRLKGFHRTSVLVETFATFATTSGTCSTGWGQRLSLCMTRLPLSLLPQLLPTWLVRPPRHTSTCYPLLLAVPIFPFPVLSSTPLMAQHPPRPSHSSALLWAAAGWGCSDLDRSQMLLGALVSSLQNTSHAGWLSKAHQSLLVKETTRASPPAPLESFALFMSPSGLSSPLRKDFALWQAAVLLSQLTWLLESSPERRYWSNTGCFVWVQYSAFSIICQSSLVVWKFVGLST